VSFHVCLSRSLRVFKFFLSPSSIVFCLCLCLSKCFLVRFCFLSQVSFSFCLFLEVFFFWFLFLFALFSSSSCFQLLFVPLLLDGLRLLSGGGDGSQRARGEKHAYKSHTKHGKRYLDTHTNREEEATALSRLFESVVSRVTCQQAQSGQATTATNQMSSRAPRNEPQERFSEAGPPSSTAESMCTLGLSPPPRHPGRDALLGR
jgi:hypothetical protein